MKGNESKFKAGTPLNTQDVTRLANTSRRVLDRYEQTGLLVPRRPGDSAKAKKQWSIEQAKITDYIRVLQHADMSIEEIAALSDSGLSPFLGTVQQQCAQDMRNARRQMKASIKDGRRCKSAQAIGTREYMYLRTLPQRWLALAPIDGVTDTLPDPSGYAHLYVDLYSVAHVVGWAPTGGTGVLASVPEDPSAPLAAYAYIELASPPMPAPRTGELLDGGCYRSIAGDADTLACNGDCSSCTHFGREPSTEEQFRWKARESENPRQWDHVLMAARTQCPYPYGVWSGASVSGDDPMSVVAFRPRLMPHTVRLPLGVTVCSLPEGAYLACQCNEDEEARTYQRLMGTTLAIPRRSFTEEDERALHARASAEAGSADGREAKGPYQPMFSQAGVTNLTAPGWVREVSLSDLHKLTIPVNMALPPQTGFCVTYSTLQVHGRNDVPRLELRILVDASRLLPEGTQPACYDTLWG